MKKPVCLLSCVFLMSCQLTKVSNKNSEINSRSFASQTTASNNPCISALINLMYKDKARELIRAVSRGYFNQVEKFLFNYPNFVNIRGEDGKTALHHAYIRGGDTKDIVELLLIRGADPSIRDRNGDTPLHDAASSRNFEEMKLLLDNGADPNIQNKVGKTALHHTVERSLKKASKLLLENGADPNIRNKDGNTPLHDAVLDNDVEHVKLLISKGADPNIKNKSNIITKHGGRTSLHLAAATGHIGITELFLKNGGNLSIQDKAGNTPLHLAIFTGNKEFVKLLLQNGADPLIKNRNGRTAFDEAKQGKHEEIASVIKLWINISNQTKN